MKNLKFSLTRLCVLFFLAVLIAPKCSKSPTESKPDPVKNLLPGASYMGYGYNIFGEYAKAEYLKSPLLKYEDYQTVVVEGKSYSIPSEIQYININTADFRSVYGVNSSQYRESLGINANLGASIPAFSLSITNNYSREYYTNNYRAFCTVQNIIKKWKLSLPYTDHHKLKSLLTNEAKNDLANLSPEILFNKYGTHFISEVIIGARADYNTSLLKSQATSSIKNNFQISLRRVSKKEPGRGASLW